MSYVVKNVEGRYLGHSGHFYESLQVARVFGRRGDASSAMTYRRKWRYGEPVHEDYEVVPVKLVEVQDGS